MLPLFSRPLHGKFSGRLLTAISLLPVILGMALALAFPATASAHFQPDPCILVGNTGQATGPNTGTFTQSFLNTCRVHLVNGSFAYEGTSHCASTKYPNALAVTSGETTGTGRFHDVSSIVLTHLHIEDVCFICEPGKADPVDYPPFSVELTITSARAFKGRSAQAYVMDNMRPPSATIYLSNQWGFTGGFSCLD